MPTRCNGWAFLFALSREARPFQKRTPIHRIAITGVGAARAECAARRVIDESRPSAIICCGFAGALRPGLKIGDVVPIAEVVAESGRRWVCDACPGTGRLLTVSRILGEPTDKRRLGEQFSADAVDMESATVARICAESGVKFGCVRVISDSVDQRLSPRLTQLLNDGDVKWWLAAAALIRWPGLLPEMIRLARDTRFAAGKLADVLMDL